MTGYQLIAIDSAGQVIATYAETEDGMAALRRCVEEFPVSEGYSGHYAEDEAGIICMEETQFLNDGRVPIHPDDLVLAIKVRGWVDKRLEDMLDLPGLPLD